MTVLLTPTVSLVGGRPSVSSMKVAMHFRKRHSHVVRAIRKIIADCPSDFNEPNFRLVEYTDAKGQKRPEYQLTRDAFTLLAMGFTGKDALAWKIKYVEAFNAMEAQLARRALRKAERRALPPPPSVAEGGAAALARLMALQSEFLKASMELGNAMSRPIDRYARDEDAPLYQQQFVKGLRTAISKQVMSSNIAFEVVEHLFKAYMAAEEMLKQADNC